MNNKDSHGVNGEKWTGFDLDGTLAEYNGWNGIEHIGKPVKKMCDLIKRLHSEGKEVKIITARVSPSDSRTNTEEARKYIEEWCQENLGFVPPITHEKDSLMDTLYDDRAVQVIQNTGITIEDAARRLFENGQKDSIAQTLVDYLMDE